ncbi:unnamed protein product [Symbiodinium natans]|uniref:Uncharacterized protein n=1 Tax=Symbiodinium natans TaxID=878477 RepID=A0A812K257_9DINO|nr:unnamed protein product [Symbiodinium natans]
MDVAAQAGALNAQMSDDLCATKAKEAQTCQRWLAAEARAKGLSDMLAQEQQRNEKQGTDIVAARAILEQARNDAHAMLEKVRNDAQRQQGDNAMKIQTLETQERAGKNRLERELANANC